MLICLYICIFCSFLEAHRICVCFHGQGEQTVLDPSVKELPEVKNVLSYVKDITKINIEEYLDGKTLTQDIAQLALVSIEVSILELLKKEGVLNDCCLYMGQSVGNYAAAYASGVLDLQSLIKIVWHRGNLTQEFIKKNSEKYKMLAIQGEIDLKNIPEKICIAGNHNPDFHTVCGPEKDIFLFKENLEKKGGQPHLISVAAPFHTRYIKSLGSLLKPCYEKINWNNPQAKFISDFKFNDSEKSNNEFESGDQVRDKLLCEQLINPMEWTNISDILKEHQITHVIIVGPGKGMKSILEKNCSELKELKILTATNLSEIKSVLKSLKDEI